MGIHFHEASPSGPSEQRGRLGPARALVSAQIPSVVWAEDALSIVHRVPTGLFDFQILVPDDKVHLAAHEICRRRPYSIIDGSQDDRWLDYKLYNQERPPAFKFGETSLLLCHAEAKGHEPDRVLVHAASTFHFDLVDPSRTCLNPDPPDAESSSIRYPTLAAFFDAIIDTFYEPPLPYIHRVFRSQLNVFHSYLLTYSLGKEGILVQEDPVTKEPTPVPECWRLLEELKYENRPFLIRSILQTGSLSFQDGFIERQELKAERFAKLGLKHVPPPMPYNPLSRQRGIPEPSHEPRLTPYLTTGRNGKPGIDWRPLARYASIAHRLLR
ncbi:hypothetical protein CC1G_02800 [Coprinopsis cinerea okayama7|uniref:Uncharacterized protein n=1 Tax=Coprinopsis cinerea (strain Okayama-7 / 130 / ATCC MYA-4618 / FGSC 9003) TaxID=240176 RepID=A8N030_COPC7|nr:hypothetical protein CC1G_02800 [Coprinopsis cinerea okayama7\|eukprot:XP_001828219.1 hypothetical protein CC1G_02800 [Coprinopsis cinerea okayama7\